MAYHQTYLPGTEPPEHDPDIERALDAWFTAKENAKRAADETKLAHGALLIHMANAGVESYPYVDPSTGKKRLVVVDREPKAKSTNAPKHRRDEDRLEDGRDSSADRDDEPMTPAAASAAKRERRKEREEEKVEVRRVKRACVEADLDPFASTRAAIAMIGSEQRQSTAAEYNDPETTPNEPKKPAGEPQARRKR